MDPATRLKVEMVLYTLVIPVGVLVAVSAPGFWGPRRGLLVGGRRLVGGLGVALGYFAAHTGVKGWPGLPPVQVEDWLPILTLGACLVFALADAAHVRAGGRLLIRVSTVCVLVGLLFQPLLDSWSRQEAAGWFVSTVGVLSLTWSAVDAAIARTPPLAVPLALAVTLAGFGVIAVLAGSALLAQLGGGLAAALVALAVLLAVRPGVELGRAAIAAAVVPALGLLVYGQHYAEIGPGPLLLLLLALSQAAWVGREGRREPSLSAVAMPVLATLVPVLVALALTSAEVEEEKRRAGVDGVSASDSYAPYDAFEPDLPY